MSYILSDIRTKVRTRIGDTTYDSSAITNFLNDTQNDIFNQYQLPFMEAVQGYTLTSGNADITAGNGLPDDFVTALDLMLTGTGYNKLLTPRDVRHVDYEDPDYEAQAAGTPNEWFKYADTIRVIPEPDRAYTVSLRYYKRPTLLSADADVPSLPAEFEEALVLGASYRILQVKDNYDQAGVLENKFMELVVKLNTKYSRAQVGMPTVMRINRSVTSKTRY